MARRANKDGAAYAGDLAGRRRSVSPECCYKQSRFSGTLSQEIGREERLRNDLSCVGCRHVKP